VDDSIIKLDIRDNMNENQHQTPEFRSKHLQEYLAKQEILQRYVEFRNEGTNSDDSLICRYHTLLGIATRSIPSDIIYELEETMDEEKYMDQIEYEIYQAETEVILDDEDEEEWDIKI
tara:strand:+ start:17 stop:370 length:354 start_codon:yes stop_codon:yes gene_type:complete